jgi:hypothetical protein
MPSYEKTPNVNYGRTYVGSKKLHRSCDWHFEIKTCMLFLFARNHSYCSKFAVTLQFAHAREEVRPIPRHPKYKTKYGVYKGGRSSKRLQLLAGISGTSNSLTVHWPALPPLA